MSQWVQHKSGQGEKWEVDEVRTFMGGSVVCVKAKVPGNAHPLLPWSEYIPCDPPEEYEDVTSKYKMLDGAESVVLGRDEQFKYIDGPHNGPCFIVERRKA
jgi:hypothetical protein